MTTRETVPRPAPLPAHVDVLVVGAGLSGIGAAYRLQTECPDRSYVILEARGEGEPGALLARRPSSYGVT
nr:NAD(P)-binding protein [Mycobacterium sp. SMC-8]